MKLTLEFKYTHAGLPLSWLHNLLPGRLCTAFGAKLYIAVR
jgi:hypothetical protein